MNFRDTYKKIEVLSTRFKEMDECFVRYHEVVNSECDENKKMRKGVRFVQSIMKYNLVLSSTLASLRHIFSDIENEFGIEIVRCKKCGAFKPQDEMYGTKMDICGICSRYTSF